ncbi:hypothetical protein [Corynebacterium sp. CCUG 70398]|uniref:hypothetical protein n=1 Tax=Corynebacterium sp. CCUG 70398 TaxID=2823891 RepID=UPI00210C31C5|nr:hypothetical protein [Corynebacterium sp. CCUG 70398]MCQ4623199.1 hypothetical protein [Corynebacterium sp. CCUG 70398]
MTESTETMNLPPFSSLFAESAPSEDALARMLDIAVDPATPEPDGDLVPDSDSLVPYEEEGDIDLADFDESSLDDGAQAPLPSDAGAADDADEIDWPEPDQPEEFADSSADSGDLGSDDLDQFGSDDFDDFGADDPLAGL